MQILLDFEFCSASLLVKIQNRAKYALKPGQNKKGLKFFQLHRFLNTFLQLAAEKKYSKKNGAAGKSFGPSYFVTALVQSIEWKGEFYLREDFIPLCWD